MTIIETIACFIPLTATTAFGLYVAINRPRWWTGRDK